MKRFTTLFVLFTILFVASSAQASDRAKLRGRSAWAWASCQQCQPASVEKKEPIKESVKTETAESGSCTSGNCSTSFPMAGGGLFRRRGR